MKNYIANDQGNWDTSKALVGRLIQQCIHHGRMARQNGQKADLYEAYRLLGTFLHTLEDFPAHSNFCELALIKMGHPEVFAHVGDQVRVQAPGGRWVAPIVTGTFGSDDFYHSLLGSATDSLSEASVTDLNKEMDKAREKTMSSSRGGPPSDPAEDLRSLFSSLPGSDAQDLSRDLDSINHLRAGPAQGGKDPQQMSAKELHATLWQILTFRDSVVKKISKTIEKIPGLGPLLEKMMDSISVFIFTTLEPFMKPLLQTATTSLNTASAEVINKHDQYEVFNDPRASDPTHSFLSKDHFNLILNESAGLLAQVIVRHTVPLITKAWDDNNLNVRQITEDITQCMFHPDFHNPQSQVQREMLKCMSDWFNKLPKKQDVLRRLTKEAVRNHEHVRLAGEGGAPASQGSWAEAQGHQMQGNIANYAQTHVPGFSSIQSAMGAAGAGGKTRGGEAASYYDSVPGNPPKASPASHGHGHGPQTGGYGAPPTSSSWGAPPSGSSYPGATAPSASGYAPSYAPSYDHPPPSFPGGPGALNSQQRSPPSSYGSSHAVPAFPGAAPGFPGGGNDASSFPSFPGSAPSFPGAAPGFPGGGPAGYSPAYGAPPPSFPGGPPGFPDADGPGGGYGGGPPPFGRPPYGQGAPGFPDAPSGW